MAEQQKIVVPSFDVVKKERDRLLRKREMRKSLMRLCGIMIVIAAAAIITATRFLPVLQLSGSSMDPTLKENEVIMLVQTKDFQRGDVIGFYYQNKILLKRVIGTPGDYIDIEEDGTVLVNGQSIEETYVIQKDKGDCDIMFPCHVKDDEYFVMGDNRAISMDSRSSEVGCVSREQIVGKTLFRIWPFERMGNIH